MFFAKSHATLRAHPSCCKVSSCHFFPVFWRAKTTLMRFTLFDSSPRTTLSFPSFHLLAWCPWRNLTACFDPNSPFSRRVDFLGQESWDTQQNVYRLPPFFDFLLGLSSASTCRNRHFRHICIRSQTCSYDIREDARIYMTNFYTFVTARNLAPFVCRASFLACFWKFCFPFVSLGLWVWCRRRRSSFGSLATVQVSLYQFVMTETTWVPIKNIVHAPSTEHALTLSSQRRLSFLLNSWWLLIFPQLRCGPWSFEFSFIWSIWSFTAVFNRERFVCPLFRAVSWSYKTKTVWNWTESCHSDLYNPSRITSEGKSLADNRACSHRTSKSCTSSFCKPVLN